MRLGDEGGKETFTSESREIQYAINTDTNTLMHQHFCHYDMRHEQHVFVVLMCSDKGKMLMYCCCVCSDKKSITGNSTPTSCFEKLLCSTVIDCSGSHQHLACFFQLGDVSTSDAEIKYRWKGLRLRADQVDCDFSFLIQLIFCDSREVMRVGEFTASNQSKLSSSWIPKGWRKLC